MSDKPLMRYAIDSDELVPVTQDWVDHAQRRLVEFATLRSDIRKLVNTPLDVPAGVVRS